jgi:hypothetical protein
MLESLKSLWAKWKVQVSFVGGVLVIATAYGTCSYDPQTVSEVEVSTAPTDETTVPVSETTEATTETTETETSTNEETTTTGE